MNQDNTPALTFELREKMKESIYIIYIDNKEKTLCFNTISGALVELEKARIDNNNLLINLFSEEEKEFLLNNSFIIDNNDNEINSLKLLHRKKCYSDLGLNLKILPTLDCQAKCDYCFQPNNKLYISEKTIDNIHSMIKSYYQGSMNKSLAITWFGGEPMLQSSWLGIVYFYKNIEEIIKSYNIECYSTMISNGEYFTEEKVKFLKDHGLKFIQITFDGPKDVHNHIKKCDIYDKVVNNINMINKEGIRVGIRVNISHDYDNKVGELLDDLAIKINEKQNVDIHFAPVMKFNELCDINCEISNSEFAFLELEFIEKAIQNGFHFNLPLRNDTSCMAIHTNSTIFSPDGNQYLCTSSIFEKEEYANINDLTFTNKNNYYKYICFDPFEDNICLNCKIFPICKGGCVKERFNGRKKCSKLKNNIEQYIRLLYNKRSL